MFHDLRAGPIYGDCGSGGGDYISNGCGGSDTNVHKVDRIIGTHVSWSEGWSNIW